MGSHEAKMTKRGNLASRVQMFRFKFTVTILVLSHCVLMANVGEFLVKSSLFVRPRSASTFLTCLSFGQLDLLKSGFSRSLIWCHRHISIFGEQEKQKLPQIVFTLIPTHPQLFSNVDSPAHPVISLSQWEDSIEAVYQSEASRLASPKRGVRVSFPGKPQSFE